MELRFAQVLRFYGHTRTCELALCDNGMRLQGVPILSGMVTSDSGFWTGHAMQRPPSEEEAGGLFSETETMGPDFRSVMAVVAYTHGRAMVIGFLPHPLTQIAPVDAEQNRDLYRHPSGLVATVNKHGDFELQHTGGAFVRIAFDGPSGPADQHQDLTPLMANANWLQQENEPVTITVSTGNRDGEAFKARIRPNGDTDVYSSGNLTISYAKDCTVNIGGDTVVNTLGATTVNSGGDCDVRSLGAVTATAAGDAHLLALGAGHACSAGPMLVGSLERLTLEAPVIDILAGELNVAAGSVGVAAGSFAVDAGTVSMAGAGIGLTAAEVSVMGVLGVTGIAVAEDFVVGVTPPIPPLPVAAVGPGGVADEIALAQAEAAEAEAELAEAEADIAAAVEEAVATSVPARGTAPPDNEGLTGPPAPDLPIV